MNLWHALAFIYIGYEMIRLVREQQRIEDQQENDAERLEQKIFDLEQEIYEMKKALPVKRAGDTTVFDNQRNIVD